MTKKTPAGKEEKELRFSHPFRARDMDAGSCRDPGRVGTIIVIRGEMRNSVRELAGMGGRKEQLQKRDDTPERKGKRVYLRVEKIFRKTRSSCVPSKC